MPEPVSILVASTLAAGALGIHGLRPPGEFSSALSPAAGEVSRKAREVCALGEQACSIFSALLDAKNRLAECVAGAAVMGWDGNVAPPVPPEAFTRTHHFLESLPLGAAMPDFSVEPDDGAISLEWHTGYRRLFSVSIGKSQRLAYAGTIGAEQWYGVTPFDGRQLPESILTAIRRVTA